MPELTIILDLHDEVADEGDDSIGLTEEAYLELSSAVADFGDIIEMKRTG